MGEILLDWEGHDKAISRKLWEFFKEEYLVDFSVTCHGQQKKVHKFVMALLFPILKESLRSSGACFDHQEPVMPATNRQSLKIPEAQCLCLDNVTNHAEDIEYLIQFAYTGKATVPSEHADCLMRIANAMEIQCLKDSLKKSDCNDQTDWTSNKLERLRPRTRLQKVVKVIEESGDLISSNDMCVADKESSLDSVECSNSSYKRTSSRRTSQKKPIKLVIQQPPEKLPKTDSTEEKGNDGEPSNEQTIKKTAKCPKCDYTAEFPYLVNRHLKKHLKNGELKTLKCPQCDFIAKLPYLMDRHLNAHARKEARSQYTCSLCKKKFKTKTLLEKHRDSECGKEPLSCKYCDFKTLYKHSLQEHTMAKHKMDVDGNPLEKNVKCPDCDYVCYAHHQLQYHVRAKHKHAGKFKCSECNFTAPYKTYLLSHERIRHQNVRKHMCEECGFRFQQLGHLKRHVLIVHKGVKAHRCNICHTVFIDLLKFNVHMERHEGKALEHKFVCDMCGHSLKWKYQLRYHMRNKHGIEMDELSSKNTQ